MRVCPFGPIGRVRSSTETFGKRIDRTRLRIVEGFASGFRAELVKRGQSGKAIDELLGRGFENRHRGCAGGANESEGCSSGGRT